MATGTQGQAQRFCSACGRQLGDADVQFCSGCGAPVVEPLNAGNAAPSPGAASSNRMWGWIVGGAFVVAALIVAFFIMSNRGGSDAQPEQQASGPSGQITPAATPAATTAPKATPVPTPAPGALPVPQPYVPQPGKPEARFGPRVEALETSIRSQLSTAAFDLSAMDIYVFSIIGTPGERLLVLDVDGTKAAGLMNSFSATGANTRFFKAVASTPDLAASQVNQVVLNYRGTNIAELGYNDTGPYTAVITFARSTLETLARGETLTDQQLKEQVQFLVKRGRHQ